MSHILRCDDVEGAIHPCSQPGEEGCLQDAGHVGKVRLQNTGHHQIGPGYCPGDGRRFACVQNLEALNDDLTGVRADQPHGVASLPAQQTHQFLIAVDQGDLPAIFIRQLSYLTPARHPSAK